MILRIDLHNHSCLSPCASLDNSPEEIARMAARAGIDIIALTDHNAALNAPAFALACARRGVVPLFGLELNPREEAHLLILFPDPLTAIAFSDRISAYIPDLGVEAGSMGDQVVVDPEERILAMPSCWYGAALQESWDHLARLGSDAGAIVIPAHVDRPQMSVYSQLGFLPEGRSDAVEAVWIGSGTTAAISGKTVEPWGVAIDVKALTRGLCVLAGSDAHMPVHVGRRPSAAIVEDDTPFEAMKHELADLAACWDAANTGGERIDQTSQEIPGTGFRSKDIPGMLPLLDFLREHYPFTTADTLFLSLRQAFHEHHAYRLDRLPPEF
ncbi:MAG: PHP domain-containing protein [Rectinema sp.]|nr:PHP domain-containing protein [Rectinema sp.]